MVNLPPTQQRAGVRADPGELARSFKFLEMSSLGPEGSRASRLVPHEAWMRLAGGQHVVARSVAISQRLIQGTGASASE